ncbi:MAG: cache domain-containing protein [Chromatiaceae bacterium]
MANHSFGGPVPMVILPPKAQRVKIGLFLLSSALFGGTALLESTEGGVDTYLYEDNKQLVRLVEDAAALIASHGTEVFESFSVEGSKWLRGERYLFVYTDQGDSIFHPIEPELEGQNLSQFRDIAGRPVVARMMEIGQRPEPDAAGWLFYLWEDPWHTQPRWKASYVHKATAPDGSVFLVGSGLYDVKIEKAFIEEAVDKAAQLIQTLGKEAAFTELRDIASAYHVLDAYIRVTDEEGNVVVDPLFPNLEKTRNVSEVSDLVGKKVFQEAKTHLQQREASWTSFTVPKRGSGLPEKRLGYTRRVNVGDETFYVGAAYVPASPLWLK